MVTSKKRMGPHRAGNERKEQDPLRNMPGDLGQADLGSNPSPIHFFLPE